MERSLAATITHVPKSAAPTYPIARPVRATDRPNDPLFDWLFSASALCPQMIAGTEVSPKVRSARMPSVNVQSGSAGKSSSVGAKVEVEDDVVDAELNITAL
jgi:hypothetical protein